MNENQQQALARLEMALDGVADAGLWLFGMESNILAYLPEDLRATGHHPLSFEARREAQNLMVRVEDHGAYKDSGGW